jgi:outer membrane immunogenic protein
MRPEIALAHEGFACGPAVALVNLSSSWDSENRVNPMNKTHVAGAAIMAVLIGAPVAQAAPFQFAGFYAGGHFGYSAMDADLSGSDFNDGGTMGGLQAGYNFINGNFMWGVETDISGNGMSPDGVCPYDANFNCNIQAGIMGTVRPRIGYAFDNFLVYATGGFAAGRFQITSTDSLGRIADNFHDGEFAWTLMAGVNFHF